MPSATIDHAGGIEDRRLQRRRSKSRRDELDEDDSGLLDDLPGTVAVAICHGQDDHLRARSDRCVQPLLQGVGRTGQVKRAVHVARKSSAQRKLAQVGKKRIDDPGTACRLHDDLRLRLVLHIAGRCDRRADARTNQSRGDNGRPPRKPLHQSRCRSKGNKITSLIESLPPRIMASRSIPTPRPPVGGMPYERAST